jgi:succinoglycan biosynthesis protein ExoA
MIPSRRDPATNLPAPHAPGFPRLADIPAPVAPFVSVIVPVRNEAAFITATLNQLLNQDYDPARFEVIVADGASTDATVAIVRELQGRHANLHLVDNPALWSSAGRNAAIEAARGDLIVLVDGHCDLGNRRYLADLVDAFERSGADCIGRPQPLDVSLATPLQRTIAAARASRLGHHPDSFIYSSEEQFVRPQSVAIAYRREVFETIGVFDEAFDACEDVEFNHRVDRAGLKCFFSPRVAVRYHPRASLRGLFRQMVRYGRGRVRLLRKHPETFTPMGFLPAVFVLGVLLGPLLAWFVPFLRALYLGCLAVYGTAVLATTVALACKARQWRMLPWGPPVFLAIHAGAGTGILLEWLRPGKRPAMAALAQPREATAPRRAA